MPRTKRSLPNLNLEEKHKMHKTKGSLPNLNLDEGIGRLGLNDHCQI